MAAKRKAYQRFGELTRQAVAQSAGEAEDPVSTELERRSGDSDVAWATLQVRLTPELRRALEHRAAAEDTTPAEIVQAALRRYLENPR